MTDNLARSAAAAALAIVLAACSTSTSTPAIHSTQVPTPSAFATAGSTPAAVIPSLPTVAPAPPLAPSLAALAPEIVAVWQTSHWLDSSGSQQILRIYRFFPDARYDYTLATCRSSTDCAVQSSESGYAQTVGGVLTLAPQTASSEGPRAYSYVVLRDPNVGDIQLHFALADGQEDIFYLSP